MSIPTTRLGRTGLTAARALVAGGAHVALWDEKLAGRDAAEAEGFKVVDLRAADWSQFAALMLSPGVPLTHPQPHWTVKMAQEAGVEILGDIELFARTVNAAPPHKRPKIIAITGTNGKSTTTALVHHILKTAGVPTLMGGNIGLPILGQEPLPEGGVYVLELSSYQIDLTQSLDCDVAVLLNITPDHLDRYDGFSGYAASKAWLFAMQSAGHVAVVGTGDEASAHIAQGLAGRTDDLVTIAASEIDQSRWPALQGPHNAQNAQAAIAVARELGIGEEAIEMGLASYASLPHRMQHVATRNGVAFVNDSKATNPESTAPALAAFPRVHWIVGGKRKGDDLDACAAHLDHVVAAYTIGEAAPLFFDLLRDKVPVVEQSGTLEAAVAHAAAAARPGDTVLLSPACASFDQFRDYEARGEAFRVAVEALA